MSVIQFPARGEVKILTAPRAPNTARIIQLCAHREKRALEAESEIGEGRKLSPVTNLESRFLSTFYDGGANAAAEYLKAQHFAGDDDNKEYRTLLWLSVGEAKFFEFMANEGILAGAKRLLATDEPTKSPNARTRRAGNSRPNSPKKIIAKGYPAP